jgi:hypothetical protein
MPLLYYWRPDNYKRDLDNGAGYHLNQLNPLMHSIDIGDTLWAFTRNKRRSYAIVAKLLVKAKTINPLKFRYGRYRLWGDLNFIIRYSLLDIRYSSLRHLLYCSPAQILQSPLLLNIHLK